jgi:hypothetical protein
VPLLLRHNAHASARRHAALGARSASAAAARAEAAPKKAVLLAAAGGAPPAAVFGARFHAHTRPLLTLCVSRAAAAGASAALCDTTSTRSLFISLN